MSACVLGLELGEDRERNEHGPRALDGHHTEAHEQPQQQVTRLLHRARERAVRVLAVPACRGARILYSTSCFPSVFTICFHQLCFHQLQPAFASSASNDCE